MPINSGRGLCLYSAPVPPQPWALLLCAAPPHCCARCWFENVSGSSAGRRAREKEAVAHRGGATVAPRLKRHGKSTRKSMVEGVDAKGLYHSQPGRRKCQESQPHAPSASLPSDTGDAARSARPLEAVRERASPTGPRHTHLGSRPPCPRHPLVLRRVQLVIQPSRHLLV